MRNQARAMIPTKILSRTKVIDLIIAFLSEQNIKFLIYTEETMIVLQSQNSFHASSEEQPQSLDNLNIDSLMNNKEIMFNKCIRPQNSNFNKRLRYADSASFIDEDQESVISNYDEEVSFITSFLCI